MPPFVIALAAGFCAVIALVALLMAIRAKQQSGAELRQRTGQALGRARVEGVKALGSLMRPQSVEELDKLKRRVVRAGLYGQDDLELFLTVRFSLLLAGLLLGLIAFGMLSADVVVGLGAATLCVALMNGAPSLWLRAREQERQQLIAHALPPALDLLVVCLEAGLGLEQALERVAREERVRSRDDALLVSELGMVLADMRVGMSVDKAFRRFAERIGGEEASNVVSAISRAAATGAKLANMLRAHADATRRKRLIAMEEASGKANARLALPLTLFLMPSALMIVAGPSFLALIQSF